MSDYDASLAVPGAQKADAGPGSKEKMSQVDADAAASRKPFQLRFGDCAFCDRASEDLVENVMRRAGSHVLGRGFRRPLLRPRASVFFPDTPSRCAAPAWMLYKTLQDKWAAKYFVPQPFRMYGSFPGAPQFAWKPVSQRLRDPVRGSRAGVVAVVGARVVVARGGP